MVTTTKRERVASLVGGADEKSGARVKYRTAEETAARKIGTAAGEVKKSERILRRWGVCGNFIGRDGQDGDR